MLKEICIAAAIIIGIPAIGLGGYYLLVAYVAADWGWVQHSMTWAGEGGGLARFFVMIGAVFSMLLSICAACAAFDAR